MEQLREFSEDQYLVRFAQNHEKFRLPELEALSVLEGVPFSYDKEKYDFMNPFLIIQVASQELACKLIRRAILVKGIYHLWAKGATYEELHVAIKSRPQFWPPFLKTTFKFQVISFGRSRDMKDQIKLIDNFAYLPFQGKIALKNPENVFAILEDFGLDQNQADPGDLPLSASFPHYIYMGRFLSKASRDLVCKYDLKKRVYLGTTSMDAELSLVMANMALAKPSSLIYDPFVGTGSFLVCCSHFGAMTLGSDIDGRQVRGKGETSVSSNISQYGLNNLVLDTVIFDVCHHPWRPSLRFDAIVTDPPYGIRAGAKKLGRRSGNRTLEEIKLEDANSAHQANDYIPPKVVYDMPDVLADLLDFAARYLTLNGRLVFWLPNAVEKDELPITPTHPCLTLIADSEQSFYIWSRRLITMVKTKEFGNDQEILVNSDPSIKQFRDRYFRLSK